MADQTLPWRRRFGSLPVLKGWPFWVFATIWTTTLAVAILANVMVAPGLVRRASAPAPGTKMIGLLIDPRLPWPTVGMPIGPEAVRSGLRRGDRLVAVDGRPVAATSEGLTAQLAGPLGTRVRVTTQSEAGGRTDHVLTRDPGHYRQALVGVGLNAGLLSWREVTAWLFDTFLFLGCAILLMSRRARDPLAPWASLMMLLMMFAFGEPQEWFAGLFANPAWAANLVNATAFSLLGIVLTVFPTGRFEPRWSLAVAVLGTVVVFASVSLPTSNSNGVGVLVYGAAVAATAARYRGMAPGAGRQQIRWALFGFAGSVVAIAVLVALQTAQAATDDFRVFAWLSLASSLVGILIFTLLMLGITVSLMRYRLYDADATISRSVVYGALTLSLLAIFAGSEKVIEIMGEQYFGERLGALAGGLGAAVAAVCIGPIHHRVTHWAEHRFRSGLVKLRDGLPPLVGDMREMATPVALADAVLVRVEKGVRAQHGAVVVGSTVVDVRDVDEATVVEWLTRGKTHTDGLHPLQVDRADPLFPLRIRLHADSVGMVGWLLLGPRPDGSFYGREERTALAEIAEPVARALAIAIKREEREASLRERDDARDRELDRLARLVDRHQARPGFDKSNGEALV